MGVCRLWARLPCLSPASRCFWAVCTPASGIADAAFLNSQMVSLHVLTILASFALFALAFGCAALYLVQNRAAQSAQQVHEVAAPPALARHARYRRLSQRRVRPAPAHARPGAGHRLHLQRRGQVRRPPAGLPTRTRWFRSPPGGCTSPISAARLGLGWRGVRLQYILLAGLVLALAVYALPTSTHHFTR